MEIKEYSNHELQETLQFAFKKKKELEELQLSETIFDDHIKELEYLRDFLTRELKYTEARINILLASKNL
jgi:hypothetical protein